MNPANKEVKKKKMKIEKIEVGICGSCKHYRCEEYDPSPPGVALSPGTITDCECCREDDFVDIEDQGFIIEGEEGADLNHQCPLWELLELRYCRKHKQWTNGECDDCVYEEVREAGAMNPAKEG